MAVALALIPPCLVSTPAGAILSKRMLKGDWTPWHQTDIDAEWQKDVPVTGLLDIQKQLGLRRGPGEERRCVVCQAESRRKCSHCLATHYCSHECQRLDWKAHKLDCRQPTPSVQRHVGVAVPDYACFWNYEAWLGQQNSEGFLGIVIMARELFREMFSHDAERRTILSLAVHGRPSCHVCGVFATCEHSSAAR